VLGRHGGFRRRARTRCRGRAGRRAAGRRPAVRRAAGTATLAATRASGPAPDPTRTSWRYGVAGSVVFTPYGGRRRQQTAAVHSWRSLREQRNREGRESEQGEQRTLHGMLLTNGASSDASAEPTRASRGRVQESR